MLARWRARQRRNQRSDERRKFGRDGSSPRAAAQARQRQFAIDVAAHGVHDRLDIMRELDLAAPAQAAGVGHQCCQRRLEPMRQIGRAAARAHDLTFLGSEQRIELRDQRLDLAWDCDRQARAVPGPDLGDAAAKHGERPQTQADLDRGRRREHQRQQAECEREIPGKGPRRNRGSRQIRGDRRPHLNALRCRRHSHAPFGHQQAGPAGARHLMLMHLARTGLVDRQWQRHVP